jgi:hypothetical protein
MREAFLIVAVILFAIDSVVLWMPTPPWPASRLTPLGLGFFAASFLAFLPG